MISHRRILSPVRLPVPPPRQNNGAEDGIRDGRDDVTGVSDVCSSDLGNLREDIYKGHEQKYLKATVLVDRKSVV